MRDRLLLQDRVQACITGSADGKTGAVAKDGSMAVFRVKLEPGKAIDVQDVQAVEISQIAEQEHQAHHHEKQTDESPARMWPPYSSSSHQTSSDSMFSVRSRNRGFEEL